VLDGVLALATAAAKSSGPERVPPMKKEVLIPAAERFTVLEREG